MEWWRRLAEERIRQAQAEGAFEGLPRGKPLPPEEPYFGPPEWRLAYKVLRNNNMVPFWLAKRRALQADIAAWREALAQADPAAYPNLRRTMEVLNQRIRDFNLEAPHPVWHLMPLRWEPPTDSLDEEDAP